MRPPEPPRALFGWTIGLSLAAVGGIAALLLTHDATRHFRIWAVLGGGLVALLVVAIMLATRIARIAVGHRWPYWTVFGLGLGVVLLASCVMVYTLVACIVTWGGMYCRG